FYGGTPPGSPNLFCLSLPDPRHPVCSDAPPACIQYVCLEDLQRPHRRSLRSIAVPAGSHTRTASGPSPAHALPSLLYSYCSPSSLQSIPQSLRVCRSTSRGSIVLLMRLSSCLTCLSKINRSFSIFMSGIKYPRPSCILRIGVFIFASCSASRITRSVKPVLLHSSARVTAFSCPFGM